MYSLMIWEGFWNFYHSKNLFLLSNLSSLKDIGTLKLAFEEVSKKYFVINRKFLILSKFFEKDGVLRGEKHNQKFDEFGKESGLL